MRRSSPSSDAVVPWARVQYLRKRFLLPAKPRVRAGGPRCTRTLIGRWQISDASGPPNSIRHRTFPMSPSRPPIAAAAPSVRSGEEAFPIAPRSTAIWALRRQRVVKPPGAAACPLTRTPAWITDSLRIDTTCPPRCSRPPAHSPLSTLSSPRSAGDRRRRRTPRLLKAAAPDLSTLRPEVLYLCTKEGSHATLRSPSCWRGESKNPSALRCALVAAFTTFAYCTQQVTMCSPSHHYPSLSGLATNCSPLRVTPFAHHRHVCAETFQRKPPLPPCISRTSITGGPARTQPL